MTKSRPEKEKTLYMIGNAHIDPVWLWRWPEGFQEVKATFRSALERLKEYDDFVFVSSSAAFFEWVELSDPEMFEEIRQRVSEGRWQIVGGWWIEPDCNLPGGESFVRQALYGQQYFKEKFGVTARVGYNIDSFGHHAMLPQILKKSGLDYYIFMRPSPHEKGLPGSLFWWESDDGTRVLALRLPFEYCTWGEGLENHILRCSAEVKAPFEAGICFYGVGNHGGGPTRQNLDSIRRMQKDWDYPQLEFAGPERLFQRLLEKDLPIPVVHDDLQHHASGTYAVHSGIKRWNRRAENALLAAEKFSAIAFWATGQPYPEDYKQAWKNVLFNQFHDILAGTSLEEAYEDARDIYGEAMAIAGRGLNYAIQSLAWKIKIEPQDCMTPLVAFNPHTWESCTMLEFEIGGEGNMYAVRDEMGRELSIQQVQSQATAKGRTRLSFVSELPSLGYRTYYVYKLQEAAQEAASDPEPASLLIAGDTFVETPRFRLDIDPQSGAISQLFDKLAGTQVFCGPAAIPVVLEDMSDTWGHNVFRFSQQAGRFKAARLRLVENGPVKSVIRVTSEFGRSTMIQDFCLYRELDQIEVKVRLDWREQHKVLKLRFPVNVSHMKATAEVPYGHIERFANGEEQPALSWVDLSGISRDTGQSYGLSILNDGKYSYDVDVRDIGLTVLRSPIYAHHMPVIPQPDEDYSFIDQGVQNFSYVLLPHRDSWETAGTVQRAAELNQPAICLLGTYHPQGTLPPSDSFISLDVDNVVITAVKKAEGGQDLILRCVEAAQEAIVATICMPHWKRTFQVRFGPCEIKTLRVPRDPSLAAQETNLLEWVE
jgi:alpha-mannosidase